MKIGILTFHRAHSYGAVLQAYALKTYLNDIGYEAEILDYRNQYLEVLYHSKEINLGKYKQFDARFGLRQRMKRIVEVMYMNILQNKFYRFQKSTLYLKPEGEGYSSDQLDKLDEYAYFIAGSDQVWNLRLTNSDLSYFLKFAKPEKRISFAASIGGYPIEENRECIHLLNNFKAISVREYATQAKLNNLGILNTECHMDPVFLVSKKRWLQITNRRMSDDYILLFEVGRNKKIINFAKQYARNSKKKIYYMATDFVRSEYIGTHNIYFADPKDFLSWIYHADYIFTNSFHASAFSIIFEKKFYCHLEKENAGNERLSNLLEIFEMEECCESSKIGDVHVKNVSKVLEQNKKSVEKYFKNCLGASQ